MFILSENNDAEFTPAGALPEKGTHATPINSASKWSIAESAETVKDNLTAEQQLKAAQKRIKQLEGITQHLREQMKLTPDYTPDARDIRKAAKLFMAEYGGSVGEIYRETGWFRGADGRWIGSVHCSPGHKKHDTFLCEKVSCSVVP